MLARCFRPETCPLMGRVTLVAVALLLLPTVVSPAPQPVRKVNECNSDIVIDHAPSMIMVGQTATVTLRVVSTDARDAMDAAIPQIFDGVTYTGHCMLPVGDPCTPDAANAFVYQGNLGGTCPGVMATDMMNGVVEFDFVPDLSLLVTIPPIPPTPDSCTITFDVTYTTSGSFPAQAVTGGQCQGGEFNSDTTVSTAVVVDPVPTLGQLALAILALLLIGGSWVTLRRRKAPSRL